MKKKIIDFIIGALCGCLTIAVIVAAFAPFVTAIITQNMWWMTVYPALFVIYCGVKNACGGS